MSELRSQVFDLSLLPFVDKPINRDNAGGFTVVTTFAGCGGSSLGYKWAGGRVLAAVEFDDNAVETYQLNHQGTPVLHRDIATVSGDELLGLIGLRLGELDILDGSPPCQGFSLSGNREFADPRNQLFRQYLRLLMEMQPKVLIMENVSGLVKGDMLLIFRDILSTLKVAGYNVRAWLLNAMHFGVPQSRERVIFVGYRSDLGIDPTPPAPFTKPISFRKACWDLRGTGPDDRMLSAVIREIAKVQPYRWRTDEALYQRIKGNKGSAFSLQWAQWDRVLGTICKSEISLSGIVHPDRERYISLAEAKRCASFPDAFQFTGRKQGIERIGNSVPPAFMQAIATHVAKVLHASYGSNAPARS